MKGFSGVYCENVEQKRKLQLPMVTESYTSGITMLLDVLMSQMILYFVWFVKEIAFGISGYFFFSIFAFVTQNS